MIKARVTFNKKLWRWEVWEDEDGKPPMHHSFHRTEADARAMARAQNKINKRDAGVPALTR